jgi:hypothetical protein
MKHAFSFRFAPRQIAAASRGASSKGLAAVAALALFVSGCGQEDGNRVPVYHTTGKISFEGYIPDGALVVLHPKDSSSPEALRPTARVQPDGSFTVTTYETGDGAPPGQYVVTVSWSQLVQSGGDYLPGPELIPPKYLSPQTSDVQVSVAEGSNELSPIVLRR